jgi:hypothetical protein
MDQIVSSTPAFERYPRLDDLERSTDRLAARHPEVEVWSPGASRSGRQIRCLEIPGGPLQALLVALPHPEEPVGTLALEYLLPLLADGLAVELGFPTRRCSTSPGSTSPTTWPGSCCACTVRRPVTSSSGPSP